MSIFDRIILLLTGLTAIYALWSFYKRYQKEKALHDTYYMLGFGVLLVSGLLLIFFGWDILASPYVLTVATLIPLGISMGLMKQFRPNYKKFYSWFALVGLLAIAVTSIGHVSSRLRGGCNGISEIAVCVAVGIAIVSCAGLINRSIAIIIYLIAYFVCCSCQGITGVAAPGSCCAGLLSRIA